MKRNPQAEVTKSALAAAVAIVMIGLTWLVYRMTQPSIPDAFVKVGQAFFESFETSQVAQMDLAAVDKSGKPLTFAVRRTNGLWTIPSHYEYPTEAIERLSRTTSELIGLERRTLASSEKGAQALLGTLDPTSDEGKADPENAGKRLRFTDSNGEPVFELIVGKQVERKLTGADSLLGLEESVERMYYVRVPTEKETYTAKLDLDISTKFSDWIEADLLELNAAEMRQLKVDNSRLDARQVMTNQGIEVRRVRVPGEELLLQKPDDFADWKIADLDEEKEVMNSENVNSLINTIEGVELIGVRPRHKYQGQSVIDGNFEFQFPAEVANNVAAQQSILDDLQDDLLSRGFGLSQDPESEQIKLVSEHGELTATTKDGLVYTLYFGSQIVGSEESIEIGAAEPKVEPLNDDANQEEKDANAEAEANKPKPEEQATARFLLVRVAHRPELMSDRPVAPQEPERLILPEGIGEPAAQSDQSDQSDRSDQSDQTKDDAPSVQLVSFSSQDETPPVNDTPPPVQDTPPPVQDTPPPTQEETPPTQEQTPPTQEETPPVLGETPPVLGETPPVLGETPPVLGETPPVLGETPPGSEAVQDPALPPTTPEKKMSREEMQQALDAEFERQKLAFENQKLQYELAVKEFETRTEKAKEKAKRLSERFANWYYVVPSSNLDRLRLTRAEVIKPKDFEAINPLGPPPGLPPGFQLPEGFQFPPTQSSKQ